MSAQLNLVEITDPTWRKLLQRVFLAAADELGQSEGEVNLKLVDDAAIRDLNRRFSGQDKATDVLSFSYTEKDPVAGSDELGDVVISLETAVRQAEEYGNGLEDELGLLLVHGYLHLLGYNHKSKANQTTMQQLQVTILGRAGLKARELQWES